jgi:hypothetical protein
MPFLSRLLLEDLDGKYWVLVAPLVYQDKRGRLFVVPPYFVTDLASIPRPLWWLWPKSGNHNEAAVLHDYLYRFGDREGVTRGEADRLFLEAMEDLEVNRVKRRLFYWAVRAGGPWRWRRYRQEERALSEPAETTDP